MKIEKQAILPLVHGILRRRYGDLEVISGQGIARGERIQLMADGQRARCVIKTSSGGRISFGRRDDGTWSGLDDCDLVAVVAPTGFAGEDHMVSMFRQQTMKEVFDANQKSQIEAGMDLPNWIAPFHEEGRGPRGAGDGFSDKALWSEPLSPPFSTPHVSLDERTQPLTIQEAKKLLSLSLGVPLEAIEIIIRA